MQLDENRGLVKYILLTLVTCGIYSYWYLYKLAEDANIICAGDGKSTPGLVQFILLSIVTCGIYAWFWYYNLGNRLQAAGPKYGLNIQENGTTLLLWYILGACLCGIGPYVAMYILMKNMNQLAHAYNTGIGR